MFSKELDLRSISLNFKMSFPLIKKSIYVQMMNEEHVDSKMVGLRQQPDN